jgi:DNA topoisomerase-1
MASQVRETNRRRGEKRPSLLASAAGMESAKLAGLRYVKVEASGFGRTRHAHGFRYLNADGGPLSDARHLQRIRSLAIPPAWTDVWICPWPSGHLQATGRDARGRKQHIYHPDWRAIREARKYDRLLEFARTLPRIRRRTRRDLAQTGLPRSKVLATIVRLLQATLIRVGNEEYLRQNNSIGLTTMRDGHARVNGSSVEFKFRGKSGVRHSIACEDERLVKIVRQCRDLPGRDLFQYVDDTGTPCTINAADVNAYIREISGCDFTTKDFRTWAATVLAASRLAKCEPCASARQARRLIAKVVSEVAERLGNTPTICRKSYVHPQVFDSYLDGSLCRGLAVPTRDGVKALSAKERAVFSFLRRGARKSHRSKAK